MSQSRLPSRLVNRLKKISETAAPVKTYEETGHKVLDNRSEAKVGTWPSVEPVNELINKRDFRYGLPGNGGHEDLQSVENERMSYEELLQFYNFMLDDKKMDMENDTKKLLEEKFGLASEDLPQRTLDALWEANKYTDREDEIFRELDEHFGFRKPGDDNCKDYDRRLWQIEFLQTMMASNRVHFAITEDVPALKQDLQLMFGDNNQTGTVNSVITISLKTENDMSSWSDEVSDERETKSKEFYQIANVFVELFEDFGEWSDYIDPVEGKPMVAERTGTLVHQTNKNYNEVKCLTVEDYGCCEVLEHSKFGKNVYVGTIVTSMKADNYLFKMLYKKNRISSLPSRAKTLTKWSMLNE